jgi:hypothetical protein
MVKSGKIVEVGFHEYSVYSCYTKILDYDLVWFPFYKNMWNKSGKK